MNIGPNVFEKYETDDEQVITLNPPRDAIDILPGESPLPEIRFHFPKEMDVSPDSVEFTGGPAINVSFTSNESN